MVLITACTSVALYVATIIVILTRCMPFHANWQVYPYPGGMLSDVFKFGFRLTEACSDACALNIPNYIALAITNVT